MTKIEESIVVDAPVAAVFDYASDWRCWPDWFEGLSDIRSTSGVGRGTGARYAYRVRVLGVSMSVETELQDFVEGQGWTGVGTRGLPHRTRWRFEAQGQSTRFTYGLEYRLPPLLLGPMLDSLFVRREWRGIVLRSLSNVQRYFSQDASRETARGRGSA
jgi:uncharacterized membrane protein